MNVLRLFLCVATMVSSTVVAQSETARAGALDEAAFIQRVMSSSPSATRVEKEIAAERAESAGAGAWPNPSVSWQREDISRGGVGETQDQVFASVPLVFSGRLGLASDAARLQSRAAEARGERARGALRLQAIRLFTQVRAAHERTQLLKTQVAAFTELTAAITARERAGDAAGYDRLRIELESAAVGELLLAAEFDQRRALTEVLGLLGPAAGEPPQFVGEIAAPRPLPGRDALDGFERRRGDLRAFTLEAEAAQASEAAAARSWIPDPTLTAGAQTVATGSERSVGYVAGVSIPLPFFEHGQGPKARARAAAELARARLAATVHEVRAQFVAAWEVAAGRRDQLIRHRREVLPRAHQLRTAATAAYRAGGAELLVLVDAERAVRDAQLRNLELAEQVVDAELELLSLSGASDGLTPGSPQ